MADNIDDINYDYEEDGRLVRETLAKEVLTKGAWSTIMFKFRELDRKTDEWKASKMAIVRYKKWQGDYKKQSNFNITNAKQAMQIVEVLQKWIGEDEAATAVTAAAAK